MRAPLSSLDKKPVYIECNPVAPEVVKRTGAIVASAGCPYVDAAALIGDSAPRARMTVVRACTFAGSTADRCLPLRDYGLDIRVLDLPATARLRSDQAFVFGADQRTAGPRHGGFRTSGSFLAGVAEPFRAELAAAGDKPHIAEILDLFPPCASPAKAVRWVQEMDQLADYMADERVAPVPCSRQWRVTTKSWFMNSSSRICARR